MRYQIFISLNDDIELGKIDVSDLKKHKAVFLEYTDFILKAKKPELYVKQTEAFLHLLNDYYTMSPDGDILISDRDYDLVTNVYKKISGNSQITTTTAPSKTWNVRRHLAPEMVGSVEKTYSVVGVITFLEQFDRDKCYVYIAPKFDGVSACVTFKVTDGKPQLECAMTRMNGVEGQDITKLFEKMETSTGKPLVQSLIEDALQLMKMMRFKECREFDIKCEVLVSDKNFERMKNDGYEYANRRSASSAIVSNPKNVELGKYLSIEQLAIRYCIPKGKTDFMYAYIYTADNLTKDLLTVGEAITLLTSHKDSLDRMIEKVKTNLEYRADGIVFYVPNSNSGDNNYPYDYLFDKSLWRCMSNPLVDMMETAIAFKINTKVGISKVIDGYWSIGRTGIATPMLKVEPCDVNETVVTDVSLSNIKKAKKFDLRYGDVVEIESAGDVIPMLKKVRHGSNTGKKIQFEMRCPICGSPLRYKKDMFGDDEGVIIRCENESCPRKVSGKLTNFITKLGVKGYSDEILDDVVKITGISSIDKLSSVSAEELLTAKGWGEKKVYSFIEAIQKIFSTPTSYAMIFGAVGIPNMAYKKWSKIFQEVHPEKIIELADKGKVSKLADKLMEADGVSVKSATTTANYIIDNWDEIRNTINQIPVYNAKSTVSMDVVFTGFRDDDMEREIESLGFGIGDNITRTTVAVIAANMHTGKAQKAKAKNIPLFSPSNFNELVTYLKHLDT